MLEQRSHVEVDTVSYTNEVAGAVIFALAAVLVCCVICFCVAKRDEYFPVEDRRQKKANDVELAGVSFQIPVLLFFFFF